MIPLSAPAPQVIDEEAEAVRGYISDGYSASEGFDAQERRQIGDAQTWEEAGLENHFSPVAGEDTPRAMEFEQGGVPACDPSNTSNRCSRRR